MVITILSQIYCNTEADNMIKVALVLFTGMLMAAAFGSHVVYAQSFSKKSSTNCEGDVCRTFECTNNTCHTSISKNEQLNSMPQIKSHGLVSNSIQQLLNSTNPLNW
jgi:hypothetical protein